MSYYHRDTRHRATDSQESSDYNWSFEEGDSQTSSVDVLSLSHEKSGPTHTKGAPSQELHHHHHYYHHYPSRHLNEFGLKSGDQFRDMFLHKGAGRYHESTNSLGSWPSSKFEPYPKSISAFPTEAPPSESEKLLPIDKDPVDHKTISTDPLVAVGLPYNQKAIMEIPGMPASQKVKSPDYVNPSMPVGLGIYGKNLSSTIDSLRKMIYPVDPMIPLPPTPQSNQQNGPMDELKRMDLQNQTPQSDYEPKSEIQSLASRTRDLENDLIKRVMDRPVTSFSIRVLGKENNERKILFFSAKFFIFLTKLVLSILVISLSSVLASQDSKVDSAIYKFFIAQGAVSLVASLLFLTTIVSFEKRNGSFYVCAVMLTTFVTFVISLAVLIPNNHCASSSVCVTRKVLASINIISFLLWLSTLVVYFTTISISRLDLLEETLDMET